MQNSQIDTNPSVFPIRESKLNGTFSKSQRDINLGENDYKKNERMKQTNPEIMIDHKELFTWREKEWN